MNPALTFANTPLDLQITICMFLLPSDILALRKVCHQSTLNFWLLKTYYFKTCKALELVSRKRIVWIAVLLRVCLDNTLFLPSLPIPDMSDLELERAAMAPRRWIGLCGAFKNHNHKMRHPRISRIIDLENEANSLFIVPGGRYLVTAGNSILVWDFGYVSTVDCKLVASAGLGDNFEYCMQCLVQATPDGKGLVIIYSKLNLLLKFIS